MAYCAQVAFVANGGHRNLRGYNQPVIITNSGGMWVWLVPSQPVPWVGQPEPGRLPELRESLLSDARWGFGGEVLSGMIDPYFGGKELAKMARLILIADELDERNITRHFMHELKVPPSYEPTLSKPHLLRPNSLQIVEGEMPAVTTVVRSWLSTLPGETGI